MSDAITAKAFAPEAIEARMGESGLRIFDIPLKKYALQRWGAPYLHIHRADYIEALNHELAKRAPGALTLDANMTHYSQDENGVTLTLADGREFSGDILIGADGIKSTVREHMLGSEAPAFTGNVAWRAVVPIRDLESQLPPPTACVWMGRGRHAVTYRLRRGDLTNFVGIVERDNWTEESWTSQGHIEDALKDFEGWDPVITNLIKSVKPDALFRWALYDRAPFSRWIDNRIALLGDAAHPMLPFLAQGAAMAVEDSWVLAREISQENRSPQEALQAYQSARLKRTSRVQRASRANMKTFHKRGKFSQLSTYGPMWAAGKLAPMIVHQRMDWLYGFDVTTRQD